MKHSKYYYDFTRNMSYEQSQKFLNKEKLTGIKTKEGTKIISYKEKLKIYGQKKTL